MDLSTTYGVIGFVLLTYLLLVRFLRLRKVNKESAYFSLLYPDESSFYRMTNDHAHHIIRYLQQYEFPFAFEASLAASLFRPYGIPSISRVLAKSGQFADVSTGSKRTADTAVLVVDAGQNPPESEKCCAAISRMNYIHSRWQKSGHIKDEDMLYTLALLAWLPVKFIERYEWRDLTAVEICAAGVFWKSLGDAMKLSYVGLPSAPPDDGVIPRSEGGWRNGTHFLQELLEWADQYELNHMVPHQLNHKAAIETEPILTYGIPKMLSSFTKHCLEAVMDVRLRRALMYADPPKYYEKIVFGILRLRKFLLRHVCLPRFKPHLRVTQCPNAHGRYNRTTFTAEPVYVEPTTGNRWGLKAWREWLAGRPLPGDGNLKPEGYTHEEVGPASLEGKGHKEFVEEKDRLMNSGRGGCPFREVCGL